MNVQSGNSGPRQFCKLSILLCLISIIIFIPLDLLGDPLVTNDNTVILTWTAPGDDYDIGQATYYDIRYSTQPVGADTSLWWDNAIQIDNEPGIYQPACRFTDLNCPPGRRKR